MGARGISIISPAVKFLSPLIHTSTSARHTPSIFKATSTKSSHQVQLPLHPRISTEFLHTQNTAMASKKILVVFGATGVQGGSVVKAVLGDAKMRAAWTVRGVTRDVSKPSAKALETMGAETVAVS